MMICPRAVCFEATLNALIKSRETRHFADNKPLSEVHSRLNVLTRDLTPCQYRRDTDCRALIETTKILTTVRKVWRWYEKSVVRTVRKVHGTNRPWYEKSTNGTKRLWYKKSMVWKVRHSPTAYS